MNPSRDRTCQFDADVSTANYNSLAWQLLELKEAIAASDIDRTTHSFWKN